MGDVHDAGWAIDFDFTVPVDVPSGASAMRLAAEGHFDELPLYVRPPRGSSARTSSSSR